MPVALGQSTIQQQDRHLMQALGRQEEAAKERGLERVKTMDVETSWGEVVTALVVIIIMLLLLTY